MDIELNNFKLSFRKSRLLRAWISHWQMSRAGLTDVRHGSGRRRMPSTLHCIRSRHKVHVDE